jgi:uncharacterized BrkB/YihY/UPF0761 family membrane protein
MNSDIVRGVLLRTCDGVARNNSLYMAAALSYYFVLSLFPALILLSGIVAYLPGAQSPRSGFRVYGAFVAVRQYGPDPQSLDYGNKLGDRVVTSRALATLE